MSRVFVEDHPACGLLVVLSGALSSIHQHESTSHLRPVARGDELRFAVEGDAGMLIGAATPHAEVIRIVTQLRGPIREATRDRFIVDHFGVAVTVRYDLPEPLTLEWLVGRSVIVQVTHTANREAVEAGDPELTVQSLVVRDPEGGVLVSACDGDDEEPAGLDLAIRVVPDRRPGRTCLAFTSRDDGVVLPVGHEAFIECDGRRYRVHAVRGGRRPAFFVGAS